MERRPPFVLTVFNSALQRVGTVGRPLELSGAVRVNAPGELAFTTDADEPRAAALQADGARVRCDYRPDSTTPLMQLISGEVNVAGTSDGPRSRRTFTITDDWELLNDWLAWPNPAGTITQQGADDAYHTVTGPAETVAVTILGANRTRLGVPVTVPASQGRGGSISVSMRMHSMAERLVPSVAAAGVNVRLLQQGVGTVNVQLSVPTVRTRVLTERSGVVQPGSSFQLSPPRVTRVVVGAGGEGTQRIFRVFTRTDWESQYGAPGKPRIRERFIDARDVGLEGGATALTAEQEAALQQRADELFEEGAPKGSLSVTLTETPRFRFGRTYLLGDQISVQLGGAPVLTDYVREVEFSWRPGEGPRVTPKTGAWADSVADSVVSAIARLGRDVSNLQRSV